MTAGPVPGWPDTPVHLYALAAPEAHAAALASTVPITDLRTRTLPEPRTSAPEPPDTPRNRRAPLVLVQLSEQLPGAAPVLLAVHLRRGEHHLRRPRLAVASYPRGDGLLVADQGQLCGPFGPESPITRW